MKGFSRHLSYANVVATMALVFAMAGSAIAAKHYLITSTGQISPKVLAALRGHEGAEGPAGKAGANGKEGAAGKDGAPGTPGAEGKEGPAGKEGPPGKEGPEGKSLGLTETEKTTLKAILPFIKFASSGVDGKPTIQFSGANVQIVNGAGKTESENGEGNLVIGYDEHPGAQTGSHNLLLGVEQSATRFGSIVGGKANTASGAWTVVFGGRSTASGLESSVTGGNRNVASGENATVSGGQRNQASGEESSVAGGESNEAKGALSAILGTKTKVLETAFGVWPEAP